MNRGRKLRAITAEGAAVGARSVTPVRAERLAQLARTLERHSRIERVIEAQRARKLRRSP